MKRVGKKNRSDAELLRELQIVTLSLGIALIVACIIALLMGSWNQAWSVLLLIGLLLIVNAFQKYFQQHPNAGVLISWIIGILLILGIASFVLSLF